MSQTSFLESVVTWDETTCKQNLHDALPKLISHLQESVVLQEEMGIMKIICVSFLPWVKVEEAEQLVYGQFSSKSCCMLDKVLDEIANLPKRSSVQAEFQALLEIVIELLDCFVQCIRSAVGGGNSLDLAAIHSLPYGAIHLLKGTYSHCKDSSEIYGDVLAYVTEPLSILFKKAHALQVALLGMLDNVVVNSGPSQQDVDDLCSVCQGLFELCQIVSNLDVKLVVGLWKAVSRLSGKHKNWVKDGLDVDAMVTYLCTEVKKGHEYLLQLAPPGEDKNELSLSQGDSAAFQKSLKVLGYQMRVIISLLDNFIDSVSECVKMAVDMVYAILRGLPPSIEPANISASCVDEIKRHLLNGVEPLINLLVQNRTFVSHMMLQGSERKSEDKLSFLQLLLKIADILPKHTDDVFQSWMSFSNDGMTWSLFDLIFSTVSACYTEMCVALTVPGNKDLPLYEYVCTHICGLVGSIPAKYFLVLEECLFKQLFSPNAFTSALTEDVWCFMARFGSADLCYSHTKLMIEVCKYTDYPHCVVKLLKRLVKFLAPDHQTQIMKCYPPEAEPRLWLEVLIPVLSSTISADISSKLYIKATDGVLEFIAAERKTYDNLLKLLISLKSLAQLICPTENSTFDVRRQPTDIVNVIVQLLELWDREWIGETTFNLCLTQLTELCGLIVEHLGNNEVLRLLDLLVDSTKLDCDNVKIAACTFLCKCRKMKYQPDSKQPLILKKIPALYTSLLLDKTAVVHHAALESFTQFAESTPYENLVPECLGNNQDLQDRVVAFLSKSVQSAADFEMLGYIRQQLVLLSQQQQQQQQQQNPADNKEDMGAPETGDVLDDIGSDEPSLKRKRCHDDEDVEIQSVICNLEQWVSRLEIATSSTALSTSSYKDQLMTIHARLKSVLDKI